MVDFTVRRDGTVEDAVYDVDPLSDTANPFGDYAVVKIDDRGGDKFDKYSRGTALEVSIDPTGVSDLSVATGQTITTNVGTTDEYKTVSNAGTYRNQGTVTSQSGVIDRFDGYVVEARELEQSGADVLEVEAYTFDQFLRRNTVSTDQTGNTIAKALESIVKNDTPVSYVAGNIEVVNDQELTRSYRGEPVEVVLRDLAFKSGNEAFGVNDSREFFFRPRETKHIDRGIDNTQWFNYDIPELGKDAINEVEVFFNDGNESVVIDSPTDKLELQDGLSLPEPGTQREELNRPLVTDIQDAEDIGRQYLQFRNATLSGTVTTYGVYDAEPGDTINITIESRGIDTEFRIAAVEYRWGRDETILTVVERRGDQDKILSRISESVKRQEMETANRDAPSNRITTTEANAIVDVDVTADIKGDNTLSVSSNETFSVSSGTTKTFNTVSNAGTLSNAGTMQSEDSGSATPSDVRFVNPGRNAVRDAWSGDGNPDISTIAIGTNGSGLSRSNTDLNNQVTSTSATESLPTSTSVEYSTSINQTGVEEIGLVTSGGTLIARAVFDTPVDLGGTVSVTLDVSNDSDVQRGVLTNDGQTAVRDVLADNNPDLPTDYAYGSDGSAVSESDTSLGNELKTVSLNDVLIQSADSNTDWSDIVSIPDDRPFEITNSEFRQVQSTYLEEAEDATINGGSIETSVDFSLTEAVQIDSQSDSIEATFTTEYDISNPRVYIRAEEVKQNDSTELEVIVDGDFEGSTPNLSSINWFSEGVSSLNSGSHTVKIQFSQTSGLTVGTANIDIIALVDDDFSFTFDNTTNTNNFSTLEGPELFASGVDFSLAKATSRINVTDGRFDSNWNDISGSQAISLSTDGSNFTVFNNTESDNFLFNNATREIFTRFTFDRFGSGANTTPSTGFNGQAIDLWELSVNPDTPSPDDIGTTNARAIVPPNTSGITGNTVREAGLKSGSTLLTRHELAEFVLETDQRLASSETTRFKGTE